MEGLGGSSQVLQPRRSILLPLVRSPPQNVKGRRLDVELGVFRVGFPRDNTGFSAGCYENSDWASSTSHFGFLCFFFWRGFCTTPAGVHTKPPRHGESRAAPCSEQPPGPRAGLSLRGLETPVLGVLAETPPGSASGGRGNPMGSAFGAQTPSDQPCREEETHGQEQTHGTWEK